MSKSNESPSRGEVWFVEFPLEENEQEFLNRPVVVLQDKDEDFEVLSVKITKHAPRDEWDFPIVNWQQASLRLQSTARISKAMYLQEDSFLFKIGILHVDDLNKIDELFSEYIERNR